MEQVGLHSFQPKLAKNLAQILAKNLLTGPSAKSGPSPTVRPPFAKSSQIDTSFIVCFPGLLFLRPVVSIAKSTKATVVTHSCTKATLQQQAPSQP